MRNRRIPLLHECYCLAPFVGRENFGTFLNNERLLGTAVEIGVHQGFFALQLLKRWRGHRYYGVDPWSDEIEGYGTDQSETLPDYWIGRGTYSHNPRSVDRQIAESKIGLDTRVHLFQGTSAEAADYIDGPLDFVYIDGNHEPDYVLQDIELWYPKLSPNGVLAGHDIYFVKSDRFTERIERVVRERFSGTHKIYLVNDRGRVWSWYVRSQP